MTKEIQKIANKIGSELNKSNEIINDALRNAIIQYYLLGQATIISSFIHYVNNEKFDVEDIKKFFKTLMENNQQLKNMVYDCIKDY